MARQRFSRGLPIPPVYVNETGTRQELARTIYLNETVTSNTMVGAVGTGNVGSPLAGVQPSAMGIAGIGTAGCSPYGIGPYGGGPYGSDSVQITSATIGVFATAGIGSLHTNHPFQFPSSGVMPIYQRILAYDQDEQLQDGWDTTLRHRRGRVNWVAPELSVSKTIGYVVTGANPTEISVSKTVAYAATSTSPTAISVSKIVAYAIIDLVIPIGVSATGVVQPLIAELPENPIGVSGTGVAGLMTLTSSSTVSLTSIHAAATVGHLTPFYNDTVSLTGILAVTTVAHLLGVPCAVLTSISGFGRAGNVTTHLVQGTQPVMMICL